MCRIYIGIDATRIVATAIYSGRMKIQTPSTDRLIVCLVSVGFTVYIAAPEAVALDAVWRLHGSPKQVLRAPLKATSDAIESMARKISAHNGLALFWIAHPDSAVAQLAWSLEARVARNRWYRAFNFVETTELVGSGGAATSSRARTVECLSPAPAVLECVVNSIALSVWGIDPYDFSALLDQKRGKLLAACATVPANQPATIAAQTIKTQFDRLGRNSVVFAGVRGVPSTLDISESKDVLSTVTSLSQDIIGGVAIGFDLSVDWKRKHVGLVTVFDPAF